MAAAVPQVTLEIPAIVIKQRFAREIIQDYIPRIVDFGTRQQLRNFVREINDMDPRRKNLIMERIRYIYRNIIWESVENGGLGINAPHWIDEIPPILGNFRRGGVQIISPQGQEIKVKSYNGYYPNYPKGAVQDNDINAERDITFRNTAIRELHEETGITPDEFNQLVLPHEHGTLDGAGYDADVLYFVYRVPQPVYDQLTNIINERRYDVQDRTSEIRSIHYKKYMKYKAKYLALVKSMGK